MVSFLGDLLIGWRIGKTVRYLFSGQGEIRRPDNRGMREREEGEREGDL